MLSTIGKLLESLVAQRLRALSAEHGLLPVNQYGVAGKCTTRALQKLLDPIYYAWCRNLLATVMSLDLKGAYDRVHRLELLRILVRKGIPDWIIRFVWSFLSDRTSTLEMPGHGSHGPFYVNIGIPQGSTLSPILFLFFASPMLDLFKESTNYLSYTIAFAYVDDMYFIVFSETYHKNCQLLESMHVKMMPWAIPHGVVFSPGKYGVIHFIRPWTRNQKGCRQLPNIPGLTKDNLKEDMRILGVQVDNKLSWKCHIEKVSSRHPIIEYC